MHWKQRPINHSSACIQGLVSLCCSSREQLTISAISNTFYLPISYLLKVSNIQAFGNKKYFTFCCPDHIQGIYLSYPYKLYDTLRMIAEGKSPW